MMSNGTPALETADTALHNFPPLPKWPFATHLSEPWKILLQQNEDNNPGPHYPMGYLMRIHGVSSLGEENATLFLLFNISSLHWARSFHMERLVLTTDWTYPALKEWHRAAFPFLAENSSLRERPDARFLTACCGELPPAHEVNRCQIPQKGHNDSEP
jgi:hypothetical protein